MTPERCRKCNHYPLVYAVRGAFGRTPEIFTVVHKCLVATFDSAPHGTYEAAVSEWNQSGYCSEATQLVAPIPLILFCPLCHARHVDQGEFATKPHHTHACQSCGHVWRPAIVPTCGVQFLPGFKDEAPGPTRYEPKSGWKL